MIKVEYRRIGEEYAKVVRTQNTIKHENVVLEQFNNKKKEHASNFENTSPKQTIQNSKTQEISGSPGRSFNAS